MSHELSGASKTSNVTTAEELILDWRRQLYVSERTAEPMEAWLRTQEWFNSEDEYAILFETLYPLGGVCVHLPRVARQRFFALERQADGPRRRRRVLGLLVPLVVLVPLAHASPPDPLWLPGIYDGADYDDVALLAMRLEGTVDERPLVVGPAPIVSAVPLTAPRASFDSTLRSPQARAPPGS